MSGVKRSTFTEAING